MLDVLFCLWLLFTGYGDDNKSIFACKDLLSWASTMGSLACASFCWVSLRYLMYAGIPSADHYCWEVDEVDGIRPWQLLLRCEGAALISCCCGRTVAASGLHTMFPGCSCRGPWHWAALNEAWGVVHQLGIVACFHVCPDNRHGGIINGHGGIGKAACHTLE